MKRAILIATLALACAPVFGKCTASDSWHGQDKQLHFGGGAAIALLVTAHTRDPMTGFWSGVAVGAGKELLDATGSGTCSLQDFLVTVAGSAVGAFTGHIVIRRNWIGYQTEF